MAGRASRGEGWRLRARGGFHAVLAPGTGHRVAAGGAGGGRRRTGPRETEGVVQLTRGARGTEECGAGVGLSWASSRVCTQKA